MRGVGRGGQNRKDGAPLCVPRSRGAAVRRAGCGRPAGGLLEFARRFVPMEGVGLGGWPCVPLFLAAFPPAIMPRALCRR